MNLIYYKASYSFLSIKRIKNTDEALGLNQLFRCQVNDPHICIPARKQVLVKVLLDILRVKLSVLIALDVPLRQLIDLILNQTDQRHDHKRVALGDQSRQLEGQTLAPARRNERHHVSALQHRVNDLLLRLVESLVAEYVGVELIHDDVPLVFLVFPQTLVEFGVHSLAYVLAFIVLLLLVRAHGVAVVVVLLAARLLVDYLLVG